MMNYEARERWIRDRICMRNYGKMRAGEHNHKIYTTVDPTEEMVQLGDNFDIEFYTGNGDGSTDGGWFVDVYEKSTDREFSIYIVRK